MTGERPIHTGYVRRGWIAAVLMGILAPGAHAEEPLLRAADLHGLTITATTTYEGTALYGYIDGGADLYREYGFVRLTVQAVVLEGEEFTAEIYRMSDDSAAFGIFSVSASAGQHLLGSSSAVTSYQSLFASGSFFVRVVNYTGTTRAGERTVGIASAILRRTGAEEFRLPEALRRVPVRIGPVQYVRGPLGIQNGYAEWGDPLEGLEPYSGYLVSSASDSVRIALMRFASPAGADEFLRRLAGNPRHAFRRDAPTRTLVVDGPEDLRAAILGPP